MMFGGGMPGRADGRHAWRDDGWSAPPGINVMGGGPKCSNFPDEDQIIYAVKCLVKMDQTI